MDCGWRGSGGGGLGAESSPRSFVIPSNAGIHRLRSRIYQNFSVSAYQSMMNINAGSLNTATLISPTDQAHIWRSRLLDAFASLELNIVRLLAKSDKVLVGENAPLGQKLEALKKLTLTPSPTKNCSVKLAKICLELAPYLSIRSDVVHAKLTVCVCDNVLSAKFCNTVNHDNPYAEVRMLTFEDLDTIGKDVRRLSNQLSQILNLPSSPPQPKQAAKADP